MESGKTEDWYRSQVGVTWKSDMETKYGWYGNRMKVV